MLSQKSGADGREQVRLTLADQAIAGSWQESVKPS
jgi:hypothetical protein